MKTFNSCPTTPYAFRVYATYEVEQKLSDKIFHEMIDGLKPILRCKDEVDGKMRTREFFEMRPEQGCKILYTFATLSGTLDRLKKNEPTKTEKAELDKAILRLEAFSFDMVGFKPGEKVTFVFDTTITATVIDNQKISYNRKEYSLSALAKD